MREIKFRAWDKGGNDFIYFSFNSTHVNFNGLAEDEINQYIGLKDKNGKEIYEGDILHWEKLEDGMQENYEVVWQKKQACFATKVITNNPIFAHFNTGYLEDQTPAQDLEVIGNIYENPELVKETV